MLDNKNYDLHTHSYYSDGELCPEKLIALAEQNGVTHLALTDHDTLAGIPSAIKSAESSSLTLIPGVEFSCNWNNQLIHIVGLNVDIDNEIINEGVSINKKNRLVRAEKMFIDLEGHNINIRDNVARLVNKDAVPTRPHFARALVEKGLAKDIKQAFKKYLVKGKPGFIPMQWPSLEEVAHWITSAGGVGVLAHPMRYKFTRSKLIRLILEMKESGLMAVEVSTSTTDDNQMKMLTEIVLEQEMYASIGSDFHNESQVWIKIGRARPFSSKLKPVWELF